MVEAGKDEDGPRGETQRVEHVRGCGVPQGRLVEPVRLQDEHLTQSGRRVRQAERVHLEQQEHHDRRRSNQTEKLREKELRQDDTDGMSLPNVQFSRALTIERPRAILSGRLRMSQP